jgi:porphobilinogen synthase
MTFPINRARRLRRNENIRRLVRECRVSVDDLVYPIFVVEGKDIKREISSMPGVFHFSIDRLKSEIRELENLKIPAILLFGVPNEKDDHASSAYSTGGIVQRAIAEIKSITDKIMVITDVCLCAYMSSGHCGILRSGEILNDKTLDLLAETAISHALAGADMVAPSDMMDGRVAKIREALDQRGHYNVGIMSYSAKYASAFYGPFREAADSAPQSGDRKSYQMDPANRLEARREVMEDIAEGADIVMIKPALAYLDVIREIREMTDVPIAAYNVSGEYSMIKAAAKLGYINEKEAMQESILSIKRAGADIIITYFAKDMAKILK